MKFCVTLTFLFVACLLCFYYYLFGLRYLTTVSDSVGSELLQAQELLNEGTNDVLQDLNDKLRALRSVMEENKLEELKHQSRNGSSFEYEKETEKEFFRGVKYASLDTVSKMRHVVQMKYRAKEKYAKR